MRPIALVFLGLGLLLCGCGEPLSSEARQALEQVRLEAAKAAVKAIEELKTEALTRLNEVQGLPEKQDQTQVKSPKNEDAEVQK